MILLDNLSMSAIQKIDYLMQLLRTMTTKLTNKKTNSKNNIHTYIIYN